jgi:hypothetical protein
VLIVGEVWFVGPAMKAPTPVKLAVPADAMVLDLPISAGYGNADAEYLAVLGHYRVINGYSGYAPPYFQPLRTALAGHRPEALAPFRALADLYVVVRPDVETPFVSWLETLPGVERLAEAGNWKVYRLPRIGNAPPTLLLPLPRRGGSTIVIAS